VGLARPIQPAAAHQVTQNKICTRTDCKPGAHAVSHAEPAGHDWGDL